MRIEVRSDKVIIDGYVNAVARDSRPVTDRKTGEKFIEQIVPGAFERAIKKNEVLLLLNHDEKRQLGSTESNLELYEDNIGLRAHAEITDAEVIEKARLKKLRGWSFGFYEENASEETLPSGMKRRYVEDMELKEVSLIDERKIPVYRGTSIELRAAAKEVINSEVLETRAVYEERGQQEQKEETEKPDLNKYKERIKELEEKKK